MPLTPADVANKQFNIKMRGYALDEVDAFLDEVESELARLLRENNDLRNRPSEEGPPPPAVAPPAPAEQPAPPPAPVSSHEGQEAALRTLLLAQRTADEAVAEARAEAAQIVQAAREEAETTLTSAREEAERTLADARREAEQLTTSSREEAEQRVTSARQQAETLEQQATARAQAVTGDLETRKRTLEAQIEELRAFEREYRTRLRAYLENQLRELVGSGGDADGGAGVPPDARAAAVAGRPGRPDGEQRPETPKVAPSNQGVGPFGAEPPTAGRNQADRNE